MITKPTCLQRYRSVYSYYTSGLKNKNGTETHENTLNNNIVLFIILYSLYSLFLPRMDHVIIIVSAPCQMDRDDGRGYNFGSAHNATRG